MSPKSHGATSAPHGGKGEKGQGAKEKTPRKGGQQHSSPVASTVRPKPSIEDSPDGVLKKHGRDACDALVRAHESAGAKEMTLQQNPAQQMLPETSALAGDSMIDTISFSTAGSSQPIQHDPERNNLLRNNAAILRGKGNDGKGSESGSPVSFSPAVQGMEVEPPEGRASSPLNATDVFQNLTTPGGSSSMAPALAPVPEGGQKGGNSGGKNLRDGGLFTSEKGSEPSISEAPMPKIILVNTNPSSQPKLTTSHQILNSTCATHCFCAHLRAAECILVILVLCITAPPPHYSAPDPTPRPRRRDASEVDAHGTGATVHS